MNEQIDELRDTWIKIGCYRETGRLERMLRVFHNALLLARKDGVDDVFLAAIISLHDRKGTLTVDWQTAGERETLCSYVNEAWEETECEILPARHLVQGQNENETSPK